MTSGTSISFTRDPATDKSSSFILRCVVLCIQTFFTHECNTLQFNEEPKITNTQLQKLTALQEVKNVNNLKEMNESFFVTIKIYH